MNKPIALLTALVALLPVILHGQEPEPTPKPPYVAKPASPLGWTMNRIAKADADPAAAGQEPGLRTVSVASILHSGVKEDTTTLSDGTSRKTYWLGAISLRQVAGTETFSVDTSNRGILGMSTPGFFGVDWVSLETYQGMVDIKGRKLFHYRLEERIPAGDEGDDLTVNREAWIDPETLRPALIRVPEGTFAFEFLSGSIPAITPPPSAIAAWKGLSRQMRLLGQRAPEVKGFSAP